MSTIDEMLDEYRRQREADTPRKYAQQQVVQGHNVEFQPDHLFCADCWELALTAFSEAIINRRYGTEHARVVFTRDENIHGMCANIKNA